MIDFDDVTITYAGADQPALERVDLHVPEGELALVVGRTGAGKSTLLRAINGLVPHFSGGHLAGRVTVAGLDTRDHPPRELAQVVGLVGQDPLAGFVTDQVEEEIAYGMEQLAVPPEAMRKRVEETLDVLGIAELRRRSLRSLSGGQQQRVAIAAALAGAPRVLVLDEPTSALDPTAAEDALAAITRLVHDLGVTVVMAEHRLERVVQYADRLILVDGSAVRSGAPAERLATSPVAPPVVELGRLAGWDPLPLSVRDARRQAPSLRERLSTADGVADPRPGPLRDAESAPYPGVRARGVVVRYGAIVAVRDVDLDAPAGQVLALMGRNGSGKSSLLWAIHGAGPRQAGRVTVSASASENRPPPRHQGPAQIGLVPQSASDLLYLESVDAELAESDRAAGQPDGHTRSLLDDLASGIDGTRHPRDLSEGQRLAVVLAVQLASAPDVVLLDEPTRGLDYGAKEQLARIVTGLTGEGRVVVIASHDVEFVAAVADRVVVMAEGEVVAQGAAADVIGTSPMFAPQVAKVLGPPWLTVQQVRQALR